MAKKVYFNSLDGLRTLSFFIVFVSHAFSKILVESLSSGKSDFLINLLRAIFRSGEEGVSIFFVISGFLITYLILQEEKNNNSISLKYFYIRRSLRIWPLFYLIIIFSLFIYPFLMNIVGISHNQNGSVWMNLFFLNNFDLLNLVQSNNIGFNPHLQITWSVAIEEQFYIFWPILFLIVKKINLRLILFPGLLLLNFLFRLYNFDQPSINYFHTFSVIGDMILGGWMAYLIFIFTGIKKFFLNLGNTYRLVIYLLIILLFFNRYSIFINENLNFTVRYIMILCYVFVVTDQCLNRNNFLKFSNLKLITKLGKYTYGLYLIHPISILFVKHLLDYNGYSYKTNWSVALILFMVSLGLTLFFSFLSYRYFESYFLKIKKTYSKT